MKKTKTYLRLQREEYTDFFIENLIEDLEESELFESNYII